MADKKFNNNIDLQKHELKQHVLHKLGAAPGAPVEGQLYYHTANKLPYVYNGTAFIFPGVNGFTDLTDTNFAGFAAGTDLQYLVYDLATTKWIPKTIVLNLDDCADVNFPIGLVTGQSLVYNGVTAKWENKIVSGAGGLGINNAGTGRMVLSGASAASNLEGQLTILWNAANELMTFGATAISKEVTLITRVKDAAGASRAAGTTIGVIGSASYYPGADFINAGIYIIAAENHAPTLANGKGTVLQFKTAANVSGVKNLAMQISQSGCVIIKPVDYTTDHTKTDFYIKGGLANGVREVINATVVIDVAGYDNKISLFVSDLAPHDVILPDPAATYIGRELEVFVFASNAESITLKTVSSLTRIWYAGAAQSSVVTTAYGRTWRLICIPINGVYHWMLNDHS